MAYTASSAKIESDFGKEGSVLTVKQRRPDAAFVDMFLSLHVNYALIPGNVSKIKCTEWKEKITKRLVAMYEITDFEKRPQHNREDSDKYCDHLR